MRTIFIFNLLFCCHFIFAQNTITGTIFANSKEEPLAEVSVGVKGGIASAITNEKGEFNLETNLKNPILLINFKGLVSEELEAKKKKIAHILKVPVNQLEAWKRLSGRVKINDSVKDIFQFSDDEYFFSQDVSMIHIKEDLLYHPKKKKVYRKPIAISLAIPGEMYAIGISKYIGHFKYEDVINLLKTDSRIKWVNPHNPIQKADYIKALEQKWFESEIYMYRHPINDKQIDLYGTPAEKDKLWTNFKNYFKSHGDLLKDIENWQKFESLDIPKKIKPVKIPDGITDLTTIWYSINLRDSLNNSLHARERELSTIIIENSLNGKLKIYRNDKLDQLMVIDEFKNNMKIPVEEYGEDEDSFDSGFGGDDWGGDDWGDSGSDGGGFDNTPSKIKIDVSNEDYDIIRENEFLFARDEALSTFSIDVDRASYSNMRRFINQNQFPPKDAIRIEELVNYFNYDYPFPQKKEPFSIYSEIGNCPWNNKNYLLHIGLQGKQVETKNLPPMNLVFLLDVSGSMNSAKKLPLLKESLKLMMDKLRPEDKVAIAVYAGASGLVLPSTSCKEKDKIIQAFTKLSAGGSTAGGAGINLAYKIAEENFIKGGNNRIVLATDGDFNVGTSSNADLERLIEEKRKSGVFLTVLGFGMGNLKDSKMETLADKGNGNYAYIDNLQEAKKTLVSEFAGTLFSIAKDVKIQVEFNPAKIAAYRLIGYENRKMENKDFDDDKKDAGDLGAGHTVTALYEIVPVENNIVSNSKLKYQNSTTIPSEDYVTVKLRYKEPEGQVSKLIENVVRNNSLQTDLSNNFKYSATVAQFGMLLRDSPYKGATTYSNLLNTLSTSKGKDSEGYKKEFEQLVKKSKELWK